MSTSENVKIKQRDATLDILRGIAVLLMVLAHSITFFNFNSTPILNNLRIFGDTVVFTIFLFVSGAVLYLSYLAYERDSKERNSRLIRRTAVLYFSYLLVSIIVHLKDFGDSINQVVLQTLKIATFYDIPSFSEFLVPFMFFGLFVIPGHYTLKRLLNSKVLTVVVAASLFMIGNLAYNIEFTAPVDRYVALFVGKEGLYRFPIFQYSAVFIVGMAFGKLSSHEPLNKKIKETLWFLDVSVLTYWIILGLYVVALPFTAFVLIQRWPPSAFFLLTGLILVFILLLLIESVMKFRVFVPSIDILKSLGKKAFSIYVIHIIILHCYRYLLDNKLDDTFVVISLFWVVLLVSWLLGLLLSRSQVNRVLVRNYFRTNWLAILATTFVFVMMMGLIRWRSHEFSALQIPVIDQNLFPSEVTPTITENEVDSELWWDKRYENRRPIKIMNDGNEALKVGESIPVLFDRRSLVSEAWQKELSVAVAYYDGEGFSPVEISIVESNNDSLLVYMETQRELSSGSSDLGYALYFSNQKLTNNHLEYGIPLNVNTDVGLEILEVENPEIIISSKKQWILKNPGLEKKYKMLPVSITFNEDSTSKLAVVVKVKGPTDKFYFARKIANGEYELEINANDLEPGRYTVQANINNRDLSSNILIVNVSRPLFVTWTMDWEGYDVTAHNLNLIAELSNKYGMPVTQLFNPRIFIADEISEIRRQQLVEWVLQRKEIAGDEIGLHLHMHTDMIKSIGLEAKDSPRWGGRTNGHDVLTSAYGYDEFDTIIKWSKQKFAEYALPEPVTYRAGGWFLDLENLQVLVANDFEIDTSGREYYIWGTNNIPGHWNLDPTTRPYRPSSSNQNTDDEPVLDIWEFPNNGRDSTNGDYPLLKERFDLNYSGKILKDPQTLTYLSHPHWFSIYDYGTLQSLFEYLESYKYENQSGPVVYLTLENTLKYYK